MSGLERTWRRALAAVCLLAAIGGAPARGADDAEEMRAKIEVNGLGWLKNREQRVSLERLLGTERAETLDANGIEDAAFLLVSALIEQGYLKPRIEAEIETAAGETRTFAFDAGLETPLPRPLEARRVTFNVKAGERYRFDEVVFTGLRAIEEESAREYFVGEAVLLARGAARLYSPSRLQRGMDGVEGELRRRGYADATVRTENVAMNDATGEVDVAVAVNEGVPREVASLRVQAGGADVEIAALAEFVGQPWSQHWQQDVAAAVRNHYYREGYPDVQVSLRLQVREEKGGARLIDVVASVETGEQVRIGEVRFEGAEQTKDVVLRRRIRSRHGDLLNPLALDQARFRLARLGVFDAVNLRYEPDDGPVRDAVFALKEGREMEVNLLFGWGSYEQLRGGVEWRQLNIFGRAHQSRLLLLQSLKSSRGEYSYTVPELFGESLDGTARVFGLQRQEESFLRQEYGGNVSVSAPIQRLGVNAMVGYTYEALRSKDNELNTSQGDDEEVTAASVDVTLVRDRRDNPLRPRSGYRAFVRAETASRYFGSGVDYQRAELGGSYHRALGAGRWLHVGLNHGVITTFGGSDDSQLPVNKRFFPGGDNSIRGYQVGEAAPLGPDGRYLGAKSYLLLNVEVEQALTTKWSIVAFVDSIGITSRLAEYPFEEELYSVGLGVRYNTLIGPLRAEYGRNLNPREVDPSGTVLLSIGYPF